MLCVHATKETHNTELCGNKVSGGRSRPAALLTFRRGGTGKIISLSHLTLVWSKKMMRHDLETGLREGFKCKSSTDGSTLSL